MYVIIKVYINTGKVATCLLSFQISFKLFFYCCAQKLQIKNNLKSSQIHYKCIHLLMTQEVKKNEDSLQL